MSISSIRFHPEGPDRSGLESWGPIAPDQLESGDAIQHGRYFFNDERLGLSAGVWDCTPFVRRMRSHANNELMVLLEGEVTIRQENGPTVTVRAGQRFFIPKGLRLQWQQRGRVRKYFVIFDGPADAGLAGVPPSLIVDPAIGLAPSTPPPADSLIGPVPVQQGKAVFADTTGQWTVGVWETGPYHRRMVPFPRYELMHVLEGGVTIRDEAGGVEVYGPGDTFFIAKGMVGDFEVTDRLRKVYCIFVEKPAAQTRAA